MAVVVKVSGSFKNTNKFLERLTAREYLKNLHNLGLRGVAALSAATPVDTGVTATSWDYDIIEEDGRVKIVWTNNHLGEDERTPVVILLQYGHGTRNGGYVVGRDFINPAIRPVFDEIANEAWLEVTKR